MEIEILDEPNGDAKAYTGGKVKWAEISDHCERERFKALSELLSSAGVPNEVSFIEIDPADFSDVLKEAMNEFDQLRIGGPLREIAHKESVRIPSSVLSLKSVDSFVKEKDSTWWPRSFLGDAITQSIAEDMTNLDFTGAVFVVGAGADARAVISAFGRVGFSRFNITDTSEERAVEMIEELRRSFFSVQFNHIARHLVTQLPSINSVAVNTISGAEDEGLMEELSYFNFLKPGGVWLDLPLVPGGGALDTEARSVGATVEQAVKVHERCDQAWSLSCFGVGPSRAAYRDRLARIISPS